MSNVSKAKLFIFGANGHIGQLIIAAITSNSRYSSHFHLTAVIRPDTLHSKDEKKASAVAKLRAAGVTLIEGDLQTAAVEEVAKWIAGQDIVLSSISSLAPGPQPDLKILDAVKLAKVSWFIPSSFGSDFTVAFTDPLPLLAGKNDVVKAIRSSPGVNTIVIMNGAFTEYFISPFAGIDLAAATLTIPYSLEAKVTTTTVADIAHLTAELLLRREESSVKNQIVYLAGDTLSYSEIHSLLEDHFKKSFQKIIVSRDEAIAAWKADVNFQNIPGRFRVVFGEQKGAYWNESWNEKHAKDIKVTTVKEYIANLK